MTKSYKRFLIKHKRLGKHKQEVKALEFIGNGLKRIERIERESLLYRSSTGRMKYLPRDLCNANMKVIVHKILNKPIVPFEHLSLNWL